jgi:hypothetical protein
MSEPSASGPGVPAAVAEPFRTVLVAATDAWVADDARRDLRNVEFVAEICTQQASEAG